MTYWLNLGKDLADFDQSWREDAACRSGVVTDLFFPSKDNRDVFTDTAEAINVCLRCDYRRECLILCAQEEWSWRNGVWGGTNFTIRRDHLKRADVIKGDFEIDEIPFPPYFKEAC